MTECLLRDFLHEFILTDDQMRQVHDRFCKEVCKGLGAKTNANSDIKCYITYVQDLPTGEETGKFLALDLGGSRFRVLMIELKGNSDARMVSETYDLAEKILLGPGTQLFDYIAACLYDFVVKNGVEKLNLSLGFTFSFPCVQIGLTKALLVRWTKGFNCSGVVNQDVGRLLREAIDKRKELKIDVVAVLNDTTGTLMSCAHQNQNCRIGLIVGTGCNACYVESVENVEKLEQKYKNKPNVIINCEWGAFGERGALDFIRTEYDQTIDNNSINKGTQLFEKMVSGMYLGELVRLVFLRAVRENLLFSTCGFRKRITDILTKKKNCIETRVLSEVDTDIAPEYANTRRSFKEIFKIKEVPDEDCEKFKMICDVVAKRSGLLVGIGLSALLNKMGLPKSVVGVDGSVYRFHGRYDAYMRESMEKFVDPKCKYDIMLSEDGSGRGAALVAAVVSEDEKKAEKAAAK